MLLFSKIIFWFVVMALAGCDGGKFHTSGGKGRDALGLTCQSPTIPETLTGMSGATLVVEGQLCPLGDADGAGKAVNIIFAVDFSGSMDKADKLINGSCGRLGAARTVIEAYNVNPKISYFVSIVAFHNQGETLVQNVPANQVASVLNPQNFCQARQPPTKVLGNTNYEAALNHSTQILSRYGSRDSKIYFLTDGMPSIGSSTPVHKSEDELEKISEIEKSRLATVDTQNMITAMRSMSGWQMYAVYLNWDNSDFEMYMKPFDLLTQMTGNAAYVKEVRESHMLQKAIDSFVPKFDKPISPQSISIEVRSDGKTPRFFQVDAATFQWSGRDRDPVNFRTLPIQLFGDAGQITRNTLIIKAPDTRFRSVSSVIDWDRR